MQTLSPMPLPKIGEMNEHQGGVPDHGGFVMARTLPTDGSQPVQLSTQPGSRLWMSPDDDLPRVLGEAQLAAQAAGQAVAIFTAEPGHWDQLFVAPLFRGAVGDAQQAVRELSELGSTPLAHSHHLVALADATSSLDVRSMPVDADLMPPRARPGAF